MTTPTPTQTAATEKPAPAGMRRRARAAIARSAAGNRIVVVLIGLLLIAGGTLVALLSYGVFGTGRASRPLLDPLVVDVLRAQPLAARLIAIAAGLLLAVLGIVWAARSLRPESRPDLYLDGGPETSIVISSAAAAEAIAQQSAELPGVGRARARLVGPEHAPAVRLTLWLAEDADVAAVLHSLRDEVLTTATDALGVPDLPAAVRLELDAVVAPPRVA
jgi:hypothetical protein